MTQAVSTATQDLPSPFLKWAGGKRSIVRNIVALTPRKFREYYEPFLGGGAVFFALHSQRMKFRAHLSDINHNLINAYRTVKERPEDLIGVLSRIQGDYLRSKSPSEYFYMRRRWHPTNDVDSAARLIFLNKTCYNGLYRVNSRGEFNVPYGRYSKPKILDAENIRAVSKALRETNADLQSSDYKKSLSNCKYADYVYLDPPYQPKSATSSFTSYTPDRFSETDQKNLAEEFTRLVDLGCSVVLSNSDTPLTRRLYSKFETFPVTVNRPINSVGSGRTGYDELIVLGKSK